MKTCGTCGTEKELSEFSLKYGKPQYNCKACHSEYRKKHYQANRQKYIDKATVNKNLYKKEYYEWMMTKSCVDCENSDIRVLQHDHLGDKSFDVSSKIGEVRLATLMAEIEKCEIVCANCHAIRTAERGKWFKTYAAVV